MSDFIRKRQYKRYLVCQPYFVWHSLEDKKDLEDIEDENDLTDLVWGDDTQDESLEETADQKIVRTFRIIDEHLMSDLKKLGEVVFLNSKDPVEKRLEDTKALLSSGKIIVKPVFEYRNAIATPFAFNTLTNEIINLKYSTKHKKQDFIDYYYDYQIVSKSVTVEDCLLFLPKDMLYKKGEINLTAVDYATKNSKASQVEYESFIKFLPGLKHGVMQWIAKNGLPKNYLEFGDFDVILDNIEKAKSSNLIEENFELDLRSKQFGVNPEFSELQEYLKCYLFGYGGNLFRREIALAKLHLAKSEQEIDFLINVLNIGSAENGELPTGFSAVAQGFGTKRTTIKTTLWEEIKRAQSFKRNYFDLERLQQYEEVKNSKNVVWYDFEGFSLPIAALNGTKPYQQIAFQVSVIVTQDNLEIKKTNLVYDPKTYSSNDFLSLISAIYQKDAEKYVVYNQNYEITRLSEMNNILKNEGHKDSQKFDFMFNEIKSKTVDLYELFRVSSPAKVPPILMYDQKTKASIKNVEKHITANGINLPRRIYPYKELEVKNGAMAMEIAINRALGIIGDNEWKIREEELKKYCENDVRAMIMVYDFVEHLLKDQNAN